MWRLLRIAAWLALAYPVLVLLLGLVYIVLPPVSTLMLGRWLSGQAVDRSYVPLSAISPQLRLTVITSEDARFCRHSGVDWSALREVIEEDEDGPSRGASTLPMQVAKNVFLWPSRSYVRKALEIPIAIYIDLLWSKPRMLEVYLNIAEWGPGVFGAEAAARKHFSKAARDLTLREAALLAASLPNPILRNAGRPSPGLRRRAALIQSRIAGTPRDCLPPG